MKGFQLAVWLPGGALRGHLLEGRYLAKWLAARNCKTLACIVMKASEKEPMAVILACQGHCPPESTLKDMGEVRRWLRFRADKMQTLVDVFSEVGDHGSVSS